MPAAPTYGQQMNPLLMQLLMSGQLGQGMGSGGPAGIPGGMPQIPGQTGPQLPIAGMQQQPMPGAPQMPLNGVQQAPQRPQGLMGGAMQPPQMPQPQPQQQGLLGNGTGTGGSGNLMQLAQLMKGSPNQIPPGGQTPPNAGPTSANPAPMSPMNNFAYQNAGMGTPQQFNKLYGQQQPNWWQSLFGGGAPSNYSGGGT